MRRATDEQIDLWHRMWRAAMRGTREEFVPLVEDIRARFLGKVCWKHNDERRAGDGYFNVGMAYTVFLSREIFGCGF